MMAIYQIKNIVNKKAYIGSSSNVTLRWNQHLENLNYNIHENYKLQEDFNKHGISAFVFSILEIVKNKKELFRKEQNWIDSINVEENYNILSYSNFNHKDRMKKSYEIINYEIDEEVKIKLKNNINIYQHKKINSIGEKKTSLSKSWYNEAKTDTIKQLSNNMHNFYSNIIKDKKFYWTTFISQQRKVASCIRGLVKKYVGLNDIPEIKYNTLAFCSNSYPNKTIQRNLKDELDINDNVFALNMLVRWIINVSDINRPINIYIPSRRMRDILIDWLNNENI
jgi:group I intron endonuclease